MSTVNARMNQRSDTAANWTSENPILGDGEIGYEKDTGKVKIGDGATVWASLAYFSGSGGGVDTVTGDGVDNTDPANPVLTFPTPGGIGAEVSGAAAMAETNAKAYADGLVTGLWDDRGAFDASVNAYPSTGGSGTAGAILKGDIWTVSVAGTLPTSQAVEVGDIVRALIDTPGNTQANWAITQNNIGYVAENAANKNAASGYPGLDALFRLTLLNGEGGNASKLTHVNTAARTYTFPDKSIAVAGTNEKLDDFATPDDNTDLNANTTNHGLVIKATAPAAGLLNVLGIINGATAYSLNDFATWVRSALLTGLSTATNAVVVATDTVLVAIGKLQAQITAFTVFPGWTAPTLLNSWANYGAGYNNAGYYKDIFGMVHIRGLVKDGTVGAVIFTLPTGHRPTGRLIITVNANNALARLDVATNGDVILVAGSNVFASMDGISFETQ